MPIRGLGAFYGRQLHLLLRWSGGWTGVAWRAVLIFATSLAAFAFTLWYVPGISVEHWPTALLAALVLALVSTISRPLLVGLLSGFSVLLVGIGTLVVQTISLVIVASGPSGLRIDGLRSAVLAAVLYAVTHTVLAAGITIANDESFFGTLVRELAVRERRRPATPAAGIVFIQIDGLGHDVLMRALDEGLMPTLARWLRAGTHVVDAWEPMLPTQTSASQAGILHGNNDGIPGFRWWEKDASRLFISNHPRDAREIQRRVSDGRGLLATGASIGNLMSGDAPRSYLTAATVDDPARELRRSHVLDWFFVSPYAYLRWVVLSVGEIAKELVQSRLERLRGIEPRGARAFPYAFARAATNVVLRHLVGALIIEELYRGTPAIYADFVDYDEIAHHAGPARPEALAALAGLDRIVALIERAALDGPRRYRFVILSDHGQTPGPMFRALYGKALVDVIAGLIGHDVTTRATAPHEHVGRLATLHLESFAPVAALLRPLRRADREHGRATPPELVVAASGNLAHVSLTRIAGRATREQIEGRYPGLICGIVEHPGIGFVLVRSEAHGSIVIGRDGTRRLRGGSVDGRDPLAGYGEHAATGLERVDGMPNCGDLVVMSRFDPVSGEAIAFEDQIGSHGGLGGPQGDAFVIHPPEAPLDGPVLGATELGARLRRWVSEIAGGSATASAR
jgi:uncharacterized membrane protein YvlD (DUF360 family)